MVFTPDRPTVATQSFPTPNFNAPDPHALTKMGIAMLIDLAQTGEIDPWDVNVVDAIDNHLSKLILTVEGGVLPENHQDSLARSGQAFLWASMLVLLKANSLERTVEPEEDDEYPLEFEGEETALAAVGLPPRLEKHIRRRLVCAPVSHRPVTLQDFIGQLKEIADRLANPLPTKIRTSRARAMSLDRAAKTIAGLAHNENLTEIATELEGFLAAAQFDILALEELIRLWVMRGSGLDTGVTVHDRVGIFWALLLLSSQSKVSLSQENFYGEINVSFLASCENN
jgi:segregation and condensation protein A